METGVGFINLDDSVKIALNIALAVARENANECYTPSHLLKALLHKDVGLRDFYNKYRQGFRLSGGMGGRVYRTMPEIHPVVRNQAFGTD